MIDPKTSTHLAFLQDHIRGCIVLYQIFLSECQNGFHRDDRKIILLLDAYVFQLGRVCNLMEPSRKGPRYAAAIARGKALRELLGVNEGELGHIRSIRNRIEHIDEDIDDYLETGPSGIIQVITDTDEEVAQFRITTPDRPDAVGSAFRSIACKSGTFTSGSASVSIPATLDDLASLAASVSRLSASRDDAVSKEFRALAESIALHRTNFAVEVGDALSVRGYIQTN